MTRVFLADSVAFTAAQQRSTPEEADGKALSHKADGHDALVDVGQRQVGHVHVPCTRRASSSLYMHDAAQMQLWVNLTSLLQAVGNTWTEAHGRNKCRLLRTGHRYLPQP